MAQYYSKTDDIIEKLFSVHKRIIDSVKIGIVTINTAWRSNSKDDKNKLLFPRILITKAIEMITDCEQKIILMHHDIFYLMEFNQYELEDIIYQHFHYLFSGHDHKKETIITAYIT